MLTFRQFIENTNRPYVTPIRDILKKLSIKEIHRRIKALGYGGTDYLRLNKNQLVDWVPEGIGTMILSDDERRQHGYDILSVWDDEESERQQAADDELERHRQRDDLKAYRLSSAEELKRRQMGSF